MWRTPLGDRALDGPEAAVVAHAVSEIFYELSESPEGDCFWQADHPGIDNLTRGQKLVLLADVSSALLRSSVRPPELTAVNEAMVNAIFRQALQIIEEEIGLAPFAETRSDRTPFRAIVVAAARATLSPDDDDAGEDDPFRIPKPACAEMETWEFLIDCLSDRVLHDADWEPGNVIEQIVLDTPPGANAREHTWLGTDRGYYTYIVPMPTDEQVRDARQALDQLVRSLG